MADTTAAVTQRSTDFAQAQHRDLWLHHPIVGDPSWDTFTRDKGNPICTGEPPHEWPVNGFLFFDEPSGRWYCYVGCYARGYWAVPAVCRLYREADRGWEDLGIILQGDPATFDGNGQVGGHMPDVSVVHADGRYHMVYDWARLADRGSGLHGGLAYAWAERPEGPWHRSDKPIIDEVGTAPILGCYVRTYGGTLLRRKSDWLILTAMSTSKNNGGTWAMAAMTAERPDGPYTLPRLLLYPQSDRFLPIHAEYFPAFVHEGFVHAPATSVARNRSFQILFRAPLEEAHHPEAWEPWQLGSTWHDEPVETEADGIWGQTFSGQVSRDGRLRVMFPSRTRSNLGTINIASRPWDDPFRNGFVLSAPAADAHAILRRRFHDFVLRLAMHPAPAGGTGTTAADVCWDCRGPIGTSGLLADVTPSPLMQRSRTVLAVAGEVWSLRTIDDHGGENAIAEGALLPTSDLNLEIHRHGSNVRIAIADRTLWTGQIAPQPGRIELCSRAGTILRVSRFELSDPGAAGSEFHLAGEAVAGASEAGNWTEVQDARFRFGAGYETTIGRAKWNYVGAGFRLHGPRGPQYGACKVVVDGQMAVARLDLHATQIEPSNLILEMSLPTGLHCVALLPISGSIPCDCLEVTQP
jgi:hypothetical protein